jgi:hypothetical protein
MPIAAPSRKFLDIRTAQRPDNFLMAWSTAAFMDYSDYLQLDVDWFR